MAAWIVGGIALAAISYASGTWWVLAAVVGGILINGLVAMLEDDLPGGYSNPDGSSTPTYATVTIWILRILGVLFIIFCVAAIGLSLFG